MDMTQIKGINKGLNTFLSQFDDSFARVGSRRNLRAYIEGQLSDLTRKSIESMALAAKMKPRTLQRFQSLFSWEHLWLRDNLQWIVAAVELIDDTGSPPKGKEVVGIQWQWCGNTSKTDNCVVGGQYLGRGTTPVATRTNKALLYGRCDCLVSISERPDIHSLIIHGIARYFST